MIFIRRSLVKEGVFTEDHRWRMFCSFWGIKPDSIFRLIDSEDRTLPNSSTIKFLPCSLDNDKLREYARKNLTFFSKMENFECLPEISLPVKSLGDYG